MTRPTGRLECAMRGCALRLAALALIGLISACAPLMQTRGRGYAEPRLDGQVAVMADGARLPFRSWPAKSSRAKKPKAVIVAVHGFNDYSKAFAAPGAWLARAGITTYAYDQRGFGGTSHRGLWAGGDLMASDLRSFTSLIHQRHPDVPIYLLGISMGGAVTMVTLAGGRPEGVRGAILGAPAIWGWKAMNPVYKTSLWVAAHTVPWTAPSGQGLGIQASDNIAMLRALGADPKIIKKTRIDTVYGLVTLMDRAYDEAGRIETPILYLYGARDQLIPRKPTGDVIAKLKGPHQVVYYKDGWHMLLRDLQARAVYRDIAAWIGGAQDRLPSGEMLEAGARLPR